MFLPCCSAYNPAWNVDRGAAAVGVAGMAGNRRKILCVEDDRETAALIAEELAGRGYDVTLAHDGREGFAAKHTRDYLWTIKNQLDEISMAAIVGQSA